MNMYSMPGYFQNMPTIGKELVNPNPENEQEIIRQRSKPGFFDEVYPYIKDSFKLHKYYKGDELCFDTAEYLIGKYQPDVMYLHLVCIDYLRHNYGVFSKELWTGYEYLDKGFARILKALKEQGLENRTMTVQVLL